MRTPSYRALALALLLAACAREPEREPAQDATEAQQTSRLDGAVEQRPAAIPLEWDPVAPMAAARSDFTLTPLLDGRLLATGGVPARDSVQASAEVFDPATDTWTSTRALSTPRYGHTATRLRDGRVLVVGGASGLQFTAPRNPLASAEIHDPATGTWSPTGSLAEARLKHTATLLPDGRVLVTGGLVSVTWDRTVRLASAEVYDPAAGTWSSAGSLAVTRSEHSATLLPDGRVLVVGGDLLIGLSASFAELYDAATGTWTRTPQLEFFHEGHTATLLKDGRVLVVNNGGGSNYFRNELYDPATNTWTKTGELILRRSRHTATLLPDGRVLFTGGADPHYGEGRSCEIYDPATGTTTLTGTMSAVRFNHAATLLPDGRVLVVGGKRRFIDEPHHASAEVLVPAPGVWKAIASPAQARSGHTATLLPSGRLLVTGGRDASGALASAELYDPVTRAWSPASPLTRARSGHTATLLRNGRVLVVGQGAELYDPATGAWSATGAPAQGRSGHTATLLPSGRVLVTGGEDAGSASASAELYDPATGAWSTTGSLARARSGHTATLLRDGRVLVVGGGASSDSRVSTEPAELYDPTTGVWSDTSPARVHAGHTATLLPSGKVLVVGEAAEVYDPVTGAWIATDAPRHPRSGHTATLLPLGAVLVSGGEASPGAELYDPDRGTWSRAAPLPEGRHGHTATLLPSGAVLVVGGLGASGPVAGAVVHQRATGTWTPTGRVSGHRYNHTATLLPDGKVLVAGGRYYHETASAELYDPATGTWSAAAPMSAARTSHTATLLPDGRVLVVGGMGKVPIPSYPFSTTSGLSTAELYDPATGTWTPTGPLARARFGHTATLLHSGKVLVLGGTREQGPHLPGELYDPATGTWTPTQPPGIQNYSQTASVLRDGRVLLLEGGGIAPGNPMAALLYDPDSDTWTPLRAPASTRHWHVAKVLPSGQVLMTSGRGSNSQFLATSELYDPATDTWTPTGSLSLPLEDSFPTATLLPTGKVLVTGGKTAIRSELYDPVTGTWLAQRATHQARDDHASTLLTDGRVLTTGGTGGHDAIMVAEVYEDTGARDGWRPVLSRPTPGEALEAGSPFEVEGALLRGLSEASGGNRRSSPTDFPLLTLLDLSRDTLHAVPVRDFSATHATATLPRVPSGQYLLSVSVNGVSSGRVVRVHGVMPLNTRLTVTGGDTFAFTANEAGASFECSLDGAAFTACASPIIHTGLAVGPHTFQVRARSADGTVEATPARHAWTVAPGAGSGSGTGTGTGTGTDGDEPSASPTGPVAQGPRGGCAAVPGETSWLLATLALLGSAVRRRRAR